jgi:hypothetical protein
VDQGITVQDNSSVLLFVATAILAVGTLVLAGATILLWREAIAAQRLARKAETARQREIQIVAVQPLLLAQPSVGWLADGSPAAIVHGVIPDGGPALGLSLVLRRDTLPDFAPAVDLGSYAPGQELTATIPLADFYKRGTYADDPMWKVAGDPHELIAQYYGLMGQRVVEHYEWWLTAVEDPTLQHDRLLYWRLARLEIVPSVAGADGLDLHFGPMLPSGPT